MTEDDEEFSCEACREQDGDRAMIFQHAEETRLVWICERCERVMKFTFEMVEWEQGVRT